MRHPSDNEPSFDVLVKGARAGDRAAWEALVHHLRGVAWGSIGGFDLSAEDRKDAFAATFFRLFERLDSIREPAKLPGWVATTARNEVRTLLRARRRDIPTELDEGDVPAVLTDPTADLVSAERHRALQAALAGLSEPCRHLLRLLTVDPPLSYAEIAEQLDIPQGSLGPTRQRCLDRLRRAPELAPFIPEVPR